jgi:glycosyltransferase involved in cell wall biosynthesis
MRVLMVDKTGGLETSQLRFEKLAAFDGIDLHALVPRKWIEHGLVVDARALPPPEGFTRHTGHVLWKGYYARGFYITGLMRALLKSKPDVIHLLEEPWSFFAWQVSRLARILCPRARLIFYSWENIYRNFAYPSRISFFQKRIDRRLHRRSAAAMCATEQARSVLELKGYQGLIEVIPYGVDAPFLMNSAEPALPRPEGAPFRVGYIGRFLKMKGLDILIEAVARTQDCELLLIGGGDYEPAMRTLIERKGIGERTTILSPVPREKVPSFLASIDALALPSRTTPQWMHQLGRVMLEAMAMGVPVIGADSGAIPEVLGDAGMLYPEDTPSSLTRCIEKLRESPELRNEMIRRGKVRIEECYNWDRFARLTYELYQRVMAS